MQLKGRVTRFSEFAGSGLAITKIGTVSFSCAMRKDSGQDPKEGDILYLEIPDLEEGMLEAVIEAAAWAHSQRALEVSLALQKPHEPRKIEAKSIPMMQY